MIVNKIGLSEILRADPWLDPDSVTCHVGSSQWLARVYYGEVVGPSSTLVFGKFDWCHRIRWRERGRESERAAVCLVQSVSELWGRAVTDTRGELRYDVSVTASYRIIALFDFFHKSPRSFPFPLFFFWWLQTFRSNGFLFYSFIFIYFYLFKYVNMFF